MEIQGILRANRKRSSEKESKASQSKKKQPKSSKIMKNQDSGMDLDDLRGGSGGWQGAGGVV